MKSIIGEHYKYLITRRYVDIDYVYYVTHKEGFSLNNKQAKKIIEEYKPHKGFYDLSSKPKTLTNIEYAQVLDTQNMLVMMAKDKEYLTENKPLAWEQIKNVSGTLQKIIFQHWGDSVLD